MESFPPHSLPQDPGTPPGATPTRSRFGRQVLLGLGFFFVALAFLGVVLPVVPTTPFLLVAAACFSRSSPRFHGWLLANPLFGPVIRDWQEHRSVPMRAKVLTVIMVGIVGGISVLYFVPVMPLKIGLAALLLVVVGWVCSHPTSVRRADAPNGAD
jgi:uncharacterized protein